MKARTRHVIMSSDYSQQEPKLLAQLCNDETMLQSYRDGKDLYAQIAAISFHKDYEDCLEFYPKGTPLKEINGKLEIVKKGEEDFLADGETHTNVEGKARRTQAKSILLGEHLPSLNHVNTKIVVC